MNNNIQQNGSNQNQIKNTHTDLIFHSIPKNKPSFLIWRVENLKLLAVPKDSYGVFFKGDTYLIYSYSESQPKPVCQHIHLWIGADSTTDEQSIGAFKMVELDDYLGYVSIQHRECQNFESERFLNYFKHKGGIKYCNGGFNYGLIHYEKKLGPSLFHLRGKRSLRLNELNNIEWASLNRNDIFIIDFYSTIFVWNGRNSNKIEKLQALNKVRLTRDERNGNCNIVIVEDGEEKELNKDELRLFESKFPLKEKMTKLKNDSQININDDVKFEREWASYLKLYKCSDARDDEDGTVKIKIIEQKAGPLYKEDLNTDDSFIIDNGRNGIWVWIGRKSDPKERQEAMRNALGFLQAKGYDENQQNSIKVTRIIEGFEPVEFRALFNRWSDQNEQRGLGRSISMNSVSKTLQTKFDAFILHNNHQLAAELQMVDDGKGNKQIWLIQNFNIFKLPETKYGEFNSSDCYIIHYSYFLSDTEKHILYYWLGRKSSLDDQTTTALKLIELDNKILNGKSLQVRIVEGKESNHFMAIFDGKIVIYQNYKSSDPFEIEKVRDSFMLQVRSYGHFNTKAIQVDYKAASLNFNDVFIISYKSETFYIWCGKGSTGDERETAKLIVLKFRKEPEIVIESQEKDDFWAALGGKQSYFNEKRSQNFIQSPIIRLFEISNLIGKINFQEIFQFSQEDLNSEETFLLDAWDVLFIWFGSVSAKLVIEDSDRITYEYLRTDPSQRGTDIPIVKIKQGLEPPNFTGFFSNWDSNGFSIKSSYTQLKIDLESKNQLNLFQQAFKEKLLQSNNKQNGLLNFNQCPKYSYDELIKPAEELPLDVITDAREVHLTESDFEKIFNMSYQQFLEKPIWKQKELKRCAHLF